MDFVLIFEYYTSINRPLKPIFNLLLFRILLTKISFFFNFIHIIKYFLVTSTSLIKSVPLEDLFHIIVINTLLK